MQDLGILWIEPTILWEQKNHNLALYAQCLDQCRWTPDLIVLPEMFHTGFSMNVEALAEDMNGPGLSFLKQRAHDHQAAFYTSLIIHQDGHYYNRAVFVYPNQQVRFYDKAHLFCLSEEPRLFQKGLQPETIHYKDWRIRLSVCYDLRFPVWLRNRYDAQRGFDYDLLLCCACWPQRRQYVWDHLLRARAIENQAYVLGVNMKGVDMQGTSYQGGSILVDPKGLVLQADHQAQAHMYHALLDADGLQQFRTKFPVAYDWDTFEIHAP